MQKQTANPEPSFVQTLTYRTPWGAHAPRLAGPNDGGIKRGDREDTGDNQADLDELGSGPAQPTVDSTSLGGESSISQPGDAGFDSALELEESDGMEIMHADDGRLGLTGLPGSPDEDWAADTGSTKNPNGQ